MAIVTVCVLTYNPDWIKFRNTLKSIICQKGVDFDVVISDDGSNENCFDKAEDYLKENHFSAYRFIANKRNQGTVKNTISALKNIESKYVKLISPGDFLYDDMVLAKFTNFAEKNEAAAYFGNAVYYSVDNNNDIKIFDTLHNPHDLKPWIDNDYKLIRRNYLYRSDFILGASLLCNTKLLLCYVNRLKNVVKYAEDMSILLMILDNIPIQYMNESMVFYEYGCGISTNEFENKKVNTDIFNLLTTLHNGGQIPKTILILRKPNNVIVYLQKFIIKLFKDPISLLFRIKKNNQKSVIDATYSKHLLKNLFFLSRT